MNKPLDRPAAIILSGNTGQAPRFKGMNEAALALTRSLGRHQVPVYRFHPDSSLLDLDSRYCVHTVCENCYTDELGLLNSLITFSRAQAFKPAIFPASDFTAEFLARHEPQLSPYMSLTCPTETTIRDIKNKQRLLERAKDAGIPVPDTHFPVNLQEALQVANSITYPAVVKPLTPHHWKTDAVLTALGHVKAVVVSSAEELLDLYHTLSPLAPEIMVQEIIQGEEERLLTFLGYISGDGTPLAGCVRKKLMQYPLDFGYCCLTETVEDPEIMELSLRLLKSLNYRGIVGVEFKRDPRDGIPKLLEINARAVRTTATAIAAGVDLPWIAYQDVTQSTNKPATEFDYTVPMHWIHLPSTVNAGWELMRKGELEFSSLISHFRRPMVFAVWDWNDLRPGIELLWVIGRKLVERCLYSLRDVIMARKSTQTGNP